MHSLADRGDRRSPTRATRRSFRAIAVLALILSLCPPLTPRPALAQADSCPEPNNGFNNSCFVGAASPTVQGFISEAGDVDAYKFDVSVPLAQVRIQLGNLPADYDLHIFDQNGAFITESTNQGTGPDGAELPMIFGTYFAFVNSAQGQFVPTAPYALTINVTPIGERPGLGGDPCPEPNDTPETACTVSGGALAFGRLDGPDDVDFYRFEISEPDTRMTARIGDGPADLTFTHIDPSTGEEESADPFTTLVGRMDNPGPQFIRISRQESEPGPLPYELLVTITTPTLAPVAAAKDPCPEPNDDNDESCGIGTGAPALGYISNPADHDRYNFDVPYRAWVHVELTDLPADYELEVQNEDGGIGSSHNSGRFPEVVDLVLDPGKYFIVVYSLQAQGSDEQPYKLSLSMVPDGSGEWPATTVYFADNFNAPGAHFTTDSRNLERYEVGYFDGEYVVKLHNPAGDNDLMPEGDEPSNGIIGNDFQLDLDARMTIPAAEVGGFTVNFRWENDGNTYDLYVDTVNGGGPGRARLAVWEDGQGTALTDWIQSPAIRRGSESNHVTLRALGNTLTVLINGQLILSVRDATYASGDIALGAFTRDRPTEVRFDNVLVTPIH